MPAYASKEELTDAIKKSYVLYDQEFDAINESEKDLPKVNIDKTPSQNLSYQIGWTGLLLIWESDELKGIDVKTPTPDYKWNNLKGLHEFFYRSYGSYSLEEQREILSKQITEILAWIENLDDDVLFLPEKRKWATTAAKWPISKWIHINTVAPFNSFRTQIRKWKKG
ncbi:ClbS/DfsB family four-helix bundle protein [Chryseobacterium taichungense]|uniref:ClbS/DfsB family four-helix bundle protein n=1 Tax=Chryseobacterium taichungense TaxID=295069 RepID=UPI0028B0C91E|nr:ClbS/DfsB family four-helix bundle protein [Chryseobacterium taichungense]